MTCIANKREAFTMIELIFVITIIGILSAVALPRLAATREDAEISKIITNARTILVDAGTYYTSRGNTNWRNALVLEVTDVPLTQNCASIDAGVTDVAPDTFDLCSSDGSGGQEACITFTTTDEGDLSVALPVVTSLVCQAVQNDSAIVSMQGNKVLGGQSVNRQ